MTRIRALYLTAMIWNVLAHYPKKDKADAFEFLGVYGGISNLCPCCQYVEDKGLEVLEHSNCEKHCPLRDFWPISRCEGRRSDPPVTSAWEAWNGVYSYPGYAVDFMSLPYGSPLIEVKEAAAIQIRDAAIKEMEKIFRQSPITMLQNEDEAQAVMKAEVDPDEEI